MVYLILSRAYERQPRYPAAPPSTVIRAGCLTPDLPHWKWFPPLAANPEESYTETYSEDPKGDGATAMTKRTVLLSAVLLITGFLFGAAWRHVQMPPYSNVYHLYSQVRDRLTGSTDGSESEGSGNDRRELAALQQAEIKRLRSLGYLNARNPAKASSVTIHDKDRAYQGLNLSTEGNAAEATLRDMSGTVIHRWHLPFEQAFPDKSAWPPKPQTSWRRVHLLADGALLAIFEGHSLIKVDRSSRLLWAYTGGVHHDLEVLRDGRIYCLTRTAEIADSFSPDDPILHDHVVLLDSSGREQKRISILQAILKSPYKTLLNQAERSGDVLHTNTIEVLDGSLADRLPAFAAGNLLISMLTIHTVAVLDPESERIVWALKDLWTFQHQPTVVGGKNLLVFDNRGDDGRSRVVEFDPATQRIEWAYANRHGSLFSKTLGSSQRLPNGNTLITESNQGRVLEVTPDHQVVWEYHSPHRVGKNNELVAQVFELIRLPPDFPTDWVD